MRYRLNATFEAGGVGEVVEADPAMVSDWVHLGFLSQVDDSGERVETDDTPRQTPVQAYTAEDDEESG